MRIAVFASGNGSNFEALARKKYRYARIVMLVTDKKDAYCIERSKRLGIPYYVFPYEEYKNKREYETAILELLKKEKLMRSRLRVICGSCRLASEPSRAGY